MSEQVHKARPITISNGTSEVPKLSGGWLQLARAVWILLAGAALIILLSSLPGYISNYDTNFGHVAGTVRAATAQFFSILSAFASLASALLSLGLSTILFRRRFDEPAAAVLSFYLLVYSVVMSGPLEIWSYYWIGETDLPLIAQTVLLALPTIALLLMFPNGRIIPSWTRWVLILTIPWNIALLLFLLYATESFSSIGLVQMTGLFILYFSFIFIGLYAQFYRYRNISTLQERQQTKWVIFGFVLWITFIIISSFPYFFLTNLPEGAVEPWWAPAAGFGWFLSLNIIPITLTISLTRYQLWDIDLVINRTLVVGGLSLSIILLYVLVVGTAGILFQTQDNLLVALAATGLVAVLFNPIRQRLQNGVNRLVYGQRDEPFEVINRLGERLEGVISPELIYPTIVETVAQTLKLPYAEIAIFQAGKLVTAESFGKPASQLEEYPLIHQGQQVGQLRVAPRSSNEPLTEADQRLLRSIASQSGTAVHAAQLTTALQHSRRDLVTAREEERRRLRRDLHDGLGPQLASQTLGLDAALKLIDDDPQAAKELIRALRQQSQGGVKDVRRLVDNLRPPALDELGLLNALKESISPYQQQDLHIKIHESETLDDLPAAVEVAAYRIIQEAITNVVRHSEAKKCDVRLSQQGRELLIDIIDDGKGLPQQLRPGVGLNSMRERTEELNGHIQFISPSSNGGTQIRVQLPL